ncbi:endonuclease/exonuclease/phosphatase family protein [Marinilabiliaceae bacterium JC017]|nr:endonuclease/exonuclease/phosphatase family protein [Marinilabiliaceae bacterium JC017]
MNCFSITYKSLSNYWFRQWVVLLLLLPLFACDPFDTHLGEADVDYYLSQELTEPLGTDTLSMMTWNIKFGGGRIDFFFDCYGDRVIMTPEEVEENLMGVCEMINHVDPDVLFIQEADVDSKRSAGIDQVQWIINHTGLNYGVYASQWKASIIPSNGLGRMNSGNAILSKYPLTDARRIGLPLIEEQNALVRYFYLRRNLLQCFLKVGDEIITLFNTHTAAYAKDGTKKKQLAIILEMVKKEAEEHTVILGGDFNTLPPATVKMKGFPDSVCEDEDLTADDYTAEADWMAPFYDAFFPAVPIDKYAQDNTSCFTHTTDKDGFWNRKLDFIFCNKPFVSYSDTTWQSVDKGGINSMSLSDHCPISVRLKY